MIDRDLSRVWRTARLALALIPFALLAAREWGYQLDLNPADHIQYIEHARALLEGRPYTDTGYIFNETMRNFAPPAYPPGLPLALAAAFAVFGVSQAVAKAVTLLFGFGFIVLAGLYFNRERRGLGVAVALTLGLSAKYTEMSVGVMSDVPFAFFVWLAILLADRREAWTLGTAALVTLSAGIAVLFRPHGLLLMPALAIWGVLRFRERGWLALTPAAALSLATVVGRWIVGPEALRGFPRAFVLWNTLTTPDFRYRLALLESHLYPFSSDLANDVFHVFSLGLMLIGLTAFTLRRWRSLAVIFALLYALALAAIPGHTIRWSFPLYPLWIFGVYNGVRLLVDRLFPHRGVAIATVLAACLAIPVTVRGLTRDRLPPRHEMPEFVELMAFLEERAAGDGDMRIAAFRPRWIAVETGSRGMPLITIDDPELQIREWCRYEITHVLLGGFDTGRRGTVASRRAIASNPEAFTSEFMNEEYEVMALDRSALGCPPAIGESGGGTRGESSGPGGSSGNMRP